VQISALVKGVVSNAGLTKTDTVIQTFWTNADMKFKNWVILLDREHATRGDRTDFVLNAIDITMRFAVTATAHRPQDRGSFRFVSSGFSSCPSNGAISDVPAAMDFKQNC